VTGKKLKFFNAKETPMPSFEIDFEVICTECGGTIKATTSFRRNVLVVETDPCQRCLDHGDRDGYDRGYDAGLADGKASTGKET
jgi:hypothetical protein